MPTLTQSLQGRDRGFLILIAEHWGIEIDNQKEAIQQLNAAMLDSNLAVEIYDALPPEGQAALQELLANGGKLRWQPFSRHYGIIREMGPTQRDRLQPHRKPETISELLFYRGFIGMSIFDTAEGPQEHIYIPSELISPARSRYKNKVSGAQPPRMNTAIFSVQMTGSLITRQRCLQHTGWVWTKAV
jgi:hypothetical protein